MKTKAIFFTTIAFASATTSLFSSDMPFTVEVSGHGPSMILIPGLACPGDVWDSTVAQFSDRFECHVVSISGFGGTPARDGDGPLLESVREGLAGYIRDKNLTQPAIVGHSLGGFVALDLASHHPDLTGKLVIVDSLPFIVGIMRPGATVEDAKLAAESTADAFSQMNAETYAGMIRGGPNGSTMAAAAEDIDVIIEWGLASDPATVGQALRELYGSDIRADLARIKSPTLVLAAWVGYAPYSSHEYVKQVYGEQYSQLEGVSLAITDTARHFIMLDEPEWTFAQIETFVAQTTP